MACGIFLDRGLSPCLLHWQMDSLPVSHQGSPLNSVFEEHKFLILIRSNLYIFPSVYCVFVVIAKNLQLGHRKVSPSSISFVALGFLFRCRIHLELIFVDTLKLCLPKVNVLAPFKQYQSNIKMSLWTIRIRHFVFVSLDQNSQPADKSLIGEWVFCQV